MGIFPGRVIPVTSKLTLQWLPCQAPGVTWSALGLVGPVFVYRDWVRLQVCYTDLLLVRYATNQPTNQQSSSSSPNKGWLNCAFVLVLVVVVCCCSRRCCCYRGSLLLYERIFITSLRSSSPLHVTSPGEMDWRWKARGFKCIHGVTRDFRGPSACI